MEARLDELLSKDAPGAYDAPFRTRFLVLRAVHPDEEVATRAAYVWGALSRATHYQGYELPPTAEALRGVDRSGGGDRRRRG